MKKENKIEQSLMIPEKEGILTKFFKWVSNLFHKKEETELVEEITNTPDTIIPKAVKMPVKVGETDENSLEYLYQLSDDELDHLDKLYDEQMEDAKNEITRLEEILQTYKQSIKKLQNQIPEDNI